MPNENHDSVYTVNTRRLRTDPLTITDRVVNSIEPPKTGYVLKA